MIITLIDLFYFIFIFSIIFTLKNIIEFMVVFFSPDPKQIKLTKTSVVLLYISITYILTFVGKLIF